MCRFLLLTLVFFSSTSKAASSQSMTRTSLLARVVSLQPETDFPGISLGPCSTCVYYVFFLFLLLKKENLFYSRHCCLATHFSLVVLVCSTIEESYRKQTQVDDEVSMVEIVDTAGQEEFASLREQWLRYGEGFFVVYSITSRISFTKELDVIFRDMDRVREDAARPPCVLFGNKARSFSSVFSRICHGVINMTQTDLERQREVSTEEGRELAQRRGMQFFEGSALTNAHVDAAFAELIRLVRASRRGAPATAPAGGSALMAAKKAASERRGRGFCTLL